MVVIYVLGEETVFFSSGNTSCFFRVKKQIIAFHAKGIMENFIILNSVKIRDALDEICHTEGDK
jgi:hypothetical protein